MEGWTGRADLKASILLALQGGALLAVFTSGELLDRARQQWTTLVAVAATGVLLLALSLSAAAMMPALGSRRRLQSEHLNQMVYFGHLRHWDSAGLADRLGRVSGREEAAMLAHQIVMLSRLNWRKYRLLQLSVGLTMIALLAFVCVGIGVVGG